jgi:outer membrane protein W
MKNTLSLLACIILFTVSSTAQFDKGASYIGLGVSFNNQHSSAVNTSGNKVSITGFQLGPDFGYFLNDKWVLGSGIGYSYNRNSTYSVVFSDQTTTTQSALTFQPYVRRYFKMGEKVALFAQISIGYSYGWESETDVNTMSHTASPQVNINTVMAGFAPGINYCLNKHWMLEASTSVLSLQYASTRNSGSTVAVDQSNVQFSLLPVGIILGVKYILHQ